VLQKSEKEQFLLDTPAATTVARAIELCAEVRNLFEKLNSLCSSMEKNTAGGSLVSKFHIRCSNS
jgi:hypothetical protein